MVRKNSVLCKLKEYLSYLIELIDRASNSCSIPFIAFGLRLLMELTALCIYIDLHHVYKDLDLDRKVSLLRSFDFSEMITRSTFFRRLVIEKLGTDEGREFINHMKSVYGTLSQFLHTPITPCVVSLTPFNPCRCVEELKYLETVRFDVHNIIKKLIYIWSRSMK
jgi:hypothetical protein